MRSWRLLPYNCNDACVNMATDEAILREYIAGYVKPTLRIYGWDPQGISLGYFQQAGKVLDLARCRQANVSFVRRITAGEAIFHGTDLSYSIICSAQDLELPVSVKESFKALTMFLINAYNDLGLEAGFFLQKGAQSLLSAKSDFCFGIKQSFDIMIKGRKLGGNAQKRKRNVIFQHGSIPFSLDINKINPFFYEELEPLGKEVISLEQAMGKGVTPQEFSTLIINSFERTFGVKLLAQELSPSELELIESLKQEKYANRDWNERKS